MGECGCSSGSWEHKIIDHEGWAWLFRVYPSCQDCSSPVGFDFFRVHPKDWHIWDVEHVPEIKTHENGTFFIPIIDPAIVRKLMEKSMIGYEPEDGPMDQVDAETLSEEAFPDLRDAYWETQRANNNSGQT